MWKEYLIQCLYANSSQTFDVRMWAHSYDEACEKCRSKGYHPTAR